MRWLDLDGAERVSPEAFADGSDSSFGKCPKCRSSGIPGGRNLLGPSGANRKTRGADPDD